MYKYLDLIGKLLSYQRNHGTKDLYRLILLKMKTGIRNQQAQLLDKAEQLVSENSSPSVKIAKPRLTATTPLRTYTIPAATKSRVSVVTDSVGSSSLFGGVGTALIFSALLANRLDLQLRIITRTERAQPQNVEHLLSLYNIKLKHEIVFQFAAFYDQAYEIDTAEGDLFITTSWWTTAATIQSVPADKIIYLLQEDERMFYPFGDERYRCETILQNKDIRFILNTKLLFDHLTQNGLAHIVQQGLWFEPAFPSNIYHSRSENKSDKKFKLFFYARPNNPRNLFELGLTILEKAISQAVINTDQWEILFVGKDLPDVTFSTGYSPTKCENLTWAEYAELLGTIDCGLSLMYTPHPSYPPLDLAASGAVVVTNRFGNKQDLSNYSKNIICANLEVDALVESLKQAVVLVQNPSLRTENYRQNQLLTDWDTAFSDVIGRLAGEL